MRVVSEEFKASAKAPVREWRLLVHNKDKNEDITSDDIVISLTMQSTGRMLGSVANSATLKIIDQSETEIAKYANDHLKISLGLKLASGQYEYVDLGWFLVDDEKLDKAKGIRTITLIDAITVMQKTDYLQTPLDFPLLISGMAEQIAKKFNIELADVSSLPNINYQINTDLYKKINNQNYRNIVEEVAGATGSMASVIDDRLHFLPLSDSIADTLDYNSMKELKIGAKYGPINSIVLSRLPQEDNIILNNEVSIAENGLTLIKIANNEIMDDEREVFAEPLLNALGGLAYNNLELTTVGLGWFEVGDHIKVIDENNAEWTGIITDINRTIDGGLKEVIKCTIPQSDTVNYALTGGITKTIYNTEIKVDKQQQEITSVVSKQESLENEVVNNFSEIHQNINNITTTIQETGGSNLLYNSVGFDTDNEGKLVDWATIGKTISETSPESVSNGGISGNQITFNPSTAITQRLAVDNSGKEYSLSVKVKKGAAGAATIRLFNNNDNFAINIPAGEAMLWKTASLAGFTPSANYLDVSVSVDADVAYFAITDLMLNSGNSTTQWTQASGETLSTQVAITRDGVKVKSSTYVGDYVQITPLEFAGYSSAGGAQKKVFTVNRDTTTVQKLQANQQIEMPPIKIVPLTSSNRQGWAFVKIS